MILTLPQAEGVFRAMMALNAIHAICHVRILRDDLTTVHVKEFLTDSIQIYVGDGIGNPIAGPQEFYADQTEFALAYDLDPIVLP